MIANIETETARINDFLGILRCPLSGERLTLDRDVLVTSSGVHPYRIRPEGVPLFVESFLSPDAQAQRHHYNKIVAAILQISNTRARRNIWHISIEPLLMQSVMAILEPVAELCCGRGEALKLFGARARTYIGIDISENMLQSTLKTHDHPNAIFVQADATRTPLAPIDTVIMLGGVHHVPARPQLFEEIARVLKPGGRFRYREPASDFLPWRALRAIIYRVSPMLDHATERPLLYEETVPTLERAGLRSVRYQTHGFFGFCLFMNSDVLFVNRLFRFVPGIRAITRASARADAAILALPGLRRAGLQVVGIAQKEAAQ
jgi:SAM-dependent methyltransferase